MNNVMTIDEIEKQFDSEWVLVEDPQTDENLEVLGGNMVAHSKDRDKVYRFAIQRKPAERNRLHW